MGENKGKSKAGGDSGETLYFRLHVASVVLMMGLRWVHVIFSLLYLWRVSAVQSRPIEILYSFAAPLRGHPR